MSFLKLEHEICCTGACFSCDIFDRCNKWRAELRRRLPDGEVHNGTYKGE